MGGPLGRTMLRLYSVATRTVPTRLLRQPYSTADQSDRLQAAIKMVNDEIAKGYDAADSLDLSLNNLQTKAKKLQSELAGASGASGESTWGTPLDQLQDYDRKIRIHSEIAGAVAVAEEELAKSK